MESPTLGHLTFDQTITALIKYTEFAKDDTYKIIVGTDSTSRTNGKNTTDYVTALVIHRIGKGGIYFWEKVSQPKAHSLRQRMYEEALISLDFARKLLDKLNKVKPQELEIEIHVDVGQVGDTREIINEIVGMVKGNGFNVKTKPEAYGASNVADRYT
ncbi:hypothetical protein COT49_00215 [candidate division WWE3 bacterium CG08_land_8_20_14_0_20_40_13]|uniref:DUF458 domain-containing protein n=1 Tax=candidate division WWE3 bacterium CG08_land_8_20_14_0_20_40_13 TaxID=1975084 RepID=A0A2H0XEW8_UNCKA|nr:MAG: hypothetical protein COT49_00215 [candidate division WWE3 bacterium CG08_land_8_20_14_0_20_40_13]